MTYTSVIAGFVDDSVVTTITECLQHEDSGKSGSDNESINFKIIGVRPSLVLGRRNRVIGELGVELFSLNGNWLAHFEDRDDGRERTVEVSVDRSM